MPEQGQMCWIAWCLCLSLSFSPTPSLLRNQSNTDMKLCKNAYSRHAFQHCHQFSGNHHIPSSHIYTQPFTFTRGHVPALLPSTLKCASLLMTAFLSPTPDAVTLLASVAGISLGTALNFWVVLVLVTVSTTTCDFSVHAPACTCPAPGRKRATWCHAHKKYIYIFNLWFSCLHKLQWHTVFNEA